jgi:hypothetical protein
MGWPESSNVHILFFIYNYMIVMMIAYDDKDNTVLIYNISFYIILLSPFIYYS